MSIARMALVSPFSNAVLKITQPFRRTLTMERTPGLGNPFATTISRRRPIKDLSIPQFEGVECLKWTNWRMRRDVKRRVLNSRYWQFRQTMHNLAYNKTLPSIVREIAVDERNSTPRDASLNRVVNRCSLTSRPRGKLIYWRLSRIVWRDLADHGLQSGVIRAKWG